jgi:acyl-CoA dehydrogenase
MNPRASTKHLSLPFFDAQHREIGNCLADWLPKQSVDESDDRSACRAWVKLLGANQWLKYCVPYGPNGLHGGAFEKIDSRALVILRENLAFHSALGDFAFAMQGLGSGAISLAGSPELQKNYLPQVARGEIIAAFALSEPDAGSDVAAMKTEALRAHSMETSGQFGYEINGLKTWISNGGIADFYCVFAKTDMQSGSRGISAFVVDANTQGLDDSEHIQVMAPHPLAVLKFNQCKVNASQLLGEENAGFKLAMATLDIFRPSVAAASLGFARRALHEARSYAQGRKMFGKTLADQQITQAKLGEMAALIDAGALLTYRAAWMRDVALASGQASREDYTAAAAMAKMVATENANKVIDMALQMHGGMGVKVGTPIEALYRDIRSLRIYEGATEVQQLILGKSVLTGVI